jgi:hypothetical protein
MLKSILGLAAFIAVPLLALPASPKAQSATDQLRAAAGGDANHVFDGSPSNGSPPAAMPDVPSPGSGEPVPNSGQDASSDQPSSSDQSSSSSSQGN